MGLNAEQEWAWGMGLLVLLFIVATSVTGMLSTIGSGTWLSINFLIQILCIAASGLGIVWLLGTKGRYY